MCMFCAAIPMAGGVGVALNAKQIRNEKLHLPAHADRERDAGHDLEAAQPERKPIMQITGGVVVLLLACSITYHTFTNLPY
jgi:hypothetical protein